MKVETKKSAVLVEIKELTLEQYHVIVEALVFTASNSKDGISRMDATSVLNQLSSFAVETQDE